MKEAVYEIDTQLGKTSATLFLFIYFMMVTYPTLKPTHFKIFDKGTCP